MASATHMPFTLPTPPGTEGPAQLATGGVSESAPLDPSSLLRPRRAVASPGMVPACSMTICGRDKCGGTASASSIHPQTLKQLEG